MAGVDMTGGVRWVGYIIYIAMVILAHKYYKDNGSGYMAYGEGIGIAFWMALVGSTISSIFTYIYIKFVDAGFIEAIKDSQIQQMQERGMSDAQIDQAMSISSSFMTPEAFLIMGVVFGIIGIVITALLVTIFTQKKSPEQMV
jgi:hypothetical protein